MLLRRLKNFPVKNDTDSKGLETILLCSRQLMWQPKKFIGDGKDGQIEIDMHSTDPNTSTLFEICYHLCVSTLTTLPICKFKPQYQITLQSSTFHDSIEQRGAATSMYSTSCSEADGDQFCRLVYR